jgi:hypothetical protein
MPRPCGCLGGNENCTFCHGSGYLQGGDSGGMSRERREGNAGPLRPGSLWRNPSPPKPKPRQEASPPHHAVVSKAPPVRSGRLSQSGIGCPYCRERFTTGSVLEKHVEGDHVAEAHDHSEAGEAKPLVRADGRIWERRSLPKTRSIAAGQPRAPIQQPVQNPIRQSLSHPVAAQPVFPKVQCPKCPSLVRTDRIAKHLRNVHGLERNPTQGRSSSARVRKLSKPVAAGGPARYRALSIGSGVSGPAGDDNDERTRALDNYWEERRLDGSRDYWQVREEGRFGSHPSFDGCDDESAP